MDYGTAVMVGEQCPRGEAKLEGLVDCGQERMLA